MPGQARASPRGHTFFFAKDIDGNLIEMIDLGYMYYVLRLAGPAGRIAVPPGEIQQLLPLIANREVANRKSRSTAKSQVASRDDASA